MTVCKRGGVILAVKPGGRLAWNGETTDVGGLRARLRAVAGTALPDSHVLLPAPAATFGSLYETLLVGGQEDVELTLPYCASADSPAATEAVGNLPTISC